MPRKPESTADEWITIVSIQVSFKSKTFKESFRRERISSLSNRHRCGCAKIPTLHPYQSTNHILQGMKPPKSFTIRYILVDPKKVEKAEGLCKPPEPSLQHPREFRFWILSLAALLSELCDGDHSFKTREVPKVWDLRSFKKKVSKKAVCEEMRRLISSPLTESENKEHGMGYIYVLRAQYTPRTIGELKIGFSKFHPEHRAHEIAQCYAMPEVVSHTPLLPHVKRLETIIHTELQSVRKIHACSRCDKDHREWFTILHAESREIVMRWSKWILQQPYVDGELTSEWKQYLDAQDFGSVDDSISLADHWEDIIEGFSKQHPQAAEPGRIGEYFNQCYWDDTCARLGIDDLGKDVCEKLRQVLALVLNHSSESNLRDLDMEKIIQLAFTDDELNNRTNEYNCPTPVPPSGLRAAGGSKRKISADELYGNYRNTKSPLGRMFHPEMPIGWILPAPDWDGRLLKLVDSQRSEEDVVKKDFAKHIKFMKETKTGSPSVSDPFEGVTESPLGDATLLPVVALKDMKSFDRPVANWIGMTPTHSGFQYLQESYKEGKWYGSKPKFRLPKAYEMAGIERLDVPQPNIKTPKKGKEKASNEDEIPFTDSGDRNDDAQNHSYAGRTFTLTRRPGVHGDTFSFSQPFTEEFIESVNQGVEECRTPSGRAKIERKFVKSLRHYGLDACFKLPDYGDTTDSEDDELVPDQECSSSSPSKIPAKRKVEITSTKPEISAKKAKQWLESL